MLFEFVILTEQFFPEFKIEAASAYFVENCDSLSELQKKEVMEQFAEKLNSEGICKKRNTSVCNIKDMAIICGRRTLRRRKRDTGEIVEEKSMDLDFNVNALKFGENPNDCPNICKFLRIPSRYCSRLCIPAYKRFLKAAVSVAKLQLERLYTERKERMVLNAASRNFQPEGIETSDVIAQCETGMMEEEDNCGKH